MSVSGPGEHAARARERGTALLEEAVEHSRPRIVAERLRAQRRLAGAGGARDGRRLGTGAADLRSRASDLRAGRRADRRQCVARAAPALGGRDGRRRGAGDRDRGRAGGVDRHRPGADRRRGMRRDGRRDRVRRQHRAGRRGGRVGAARRSRSSCREPACRACASSTRCSAASSRSPSPRCCRAIPWKPCTAPPRRCWGRSRARSRTWRGRWSAGDRELAERAWARSYGLRLGRARRCCRRGAEMLRLAPFRGGTREQFARYEQAATQIRTALTSVEALSRGAVRALSVGDNVPAPVPTRCATSPRRCARSTSTSTTPPAGRSSRGAGAARRRRGDARARADLEPVGQRDRGPSALDRRRPDPRLGAGPRRSRATRARRQPTGSRPASTPCRLSPPDGP